MTYAAFKLPSSSLDQEGAQRQNKIKLFCITYLLALHLKSLSQFHLWNTQKMEFSAPQTFLFQTLNRTLGIQFLFQG